MQRLPPPWPTRLSALLAGTAATCALAGCGSSHSPGAGIDPARAVPASAPVYASAIVRPGGALAAKARAVGRALTHQADPYLRLLGLLQTPGSPALEFKRDVAPWLGPRAGIFLGSVPASGGADLGSLLSSSQGGLLGGSAPAPFPFASSGGAPAAAPPQGAIVLDTSDARAASSFLSTQASRAGARPASYRGVAYEATAAGVAFGLVDRFAVIGSEAALRSVIDTTAGGPSLAGASTYASLLAAAPSEALAHLYSARGAAPSSHASGSAGLLGLLGGGRPANVSLLPATSSIALDADTLAAAAPAGLISSEGESGRALGELPGDAFLAIGFGSGRELTQTALALRGLAGLGGKGSEAPSPGLSVKGLLAGLLSPVALMSESSSEAKRDFQSWLGAGAVFASGTGLIDLKAGLVISSKNPASSRAAVVKLASKLRGTGASVKAVSIPGTDAALSATLAGLPVALDIADGRDAKGQTKFVIGLGEASVAAALGPASTLSTSASYSAASAELGEGIQPSVIVEVPILLSLLEGAGLSEDPTIAPLVPYLRPLTTVAAGAKRLAGSLERVRAVLTLRPS